MFVIRALYWFYAKYIFSVKIHTFFFNYLATMYDIWMLIFIIFNLS